MLFLAGVRSTVPQELELDSGLPGRGRDSCSQAQQIVKSSHAFAMVFQYVSICFLHLDSCTQVFAT